MSPSRRPAPLLPAPLARLAGFALLGGLAAIEWARMSAGTSAGRALAWVAAGVAAAAAVLAADRLPVRLRAPATVIAALLGVLGALVVSGIDVVLLKPARWGELTEGIGRGVEALGGVRLPYAGKDPWPGATLELAGALLCVLAALLAIWPRERSFGHPLLSVGALLVFLATPVISLGGAQPLGLGLAVAALTACFLWLERLPARPGAGVLVLAAIAFAVALPLGAAADREEPWFDYRTFAEGIGPADPVRFSWDHSYGPIDWPREGVELFRVEAEEPFYWKALALDVFDGDRWTARTRSVGAGEDPESDLPPDWRDRNGWTERFHVSLRRLRTETVVGAGTIVDVIDSTKPVRPELFPGRWASAGRPLGRGDSYTVEAHIPRPSPEQLSGAPTAAPFGPPAEARTITVAFRADALDDGPRLPGPRVFRGRPIEEAEVEFPPFAELERTPVAHYNRLGVDDSGTKALERSHYQRTWELARRLKERAGTPYRYVLRVNALLRSDRYSYSETPPRHGAEAPLEHFLFEGQRGYCQQFSGAMALLLRMGGIPARIATGFSPGGFRKRRGDWIIRDTDAHSWVEAWFDGIGWVTFDPTPETTPARSQVAAIDPDEELEEAEVGAVATPVPPQDPTARRPEGLLRDAERGGGVAPEAAGGAGTPWWAYGLAAGAIAAVLLLLAARSGRRPRRSRRSALPGGLDRAIAELELALRRSGRPTPASTTLAQLERLLGTSPEGAAYLRALRAARYAGTPQLPTRGQRAAFRRELATGLGVTGRLRALWALPPRLR